MKYMFKPLIAALALAAGGAHAATVGQTISLPGLGTPLVFAGGSGKLAFSAGSSFDGTDPSTVGGLIGALNVGKIAITELPPAYVTQTSIEDEFGDDIRVGASATAPVTSLTVDPLTGQVLGVGSSGGARQVGSRITGVLNGGSASVTNLRFDLVNKIVYADLVGRSNALGTRPAVDYVFSNTALWTFDTITGPTNFPVNLGGDLAATMAAAGFDVATGASGYTFTAENVISGLKVTTTGFNFFKNSLGLLATGVDALNAVNADPLGWGSISAKITVTAVPEPSTYGLALAGLLVAGAAARRRSA